MNPNKLTNRRKKPSAANFKKNFGELLPPNVCSAIDRLYRALDWRWSGEALPGARPSRAKSQPRHTSPALIAGR